MGFAARYKGKGGYAHLLTIGLPLVMSMLSHSLMQFTDRIFLANYSLDAIAAALPAAVSAFLFLSFFMGVAEYTSVFVAQYTGAAQPELVGATLWQGLWFCIPASLILMALSFFSEILFALGGHPAHLIPLETAYFNILMMGGGFVAVSTTLSCFYSGRGMTLPVMIVNIIGTVVNIPLDYALINGYGIFPEMGIRGAGIATVISSGVIVVLFSAMIFNSKNNAEFGVWKKRAFDPQLFLRFLRYGLPGGVNFFVDIFGISFFVFMIGRLGTTELAATNMAISLDMIAFLPIVGMGIAAGVVVGQGIGAGRPEIGVRGTYSALHLNLLYMCIMAALFVFFPKPLIALFQDRQMNAAQFAAVAETGRHMLQYVAVYSIFDAVAITYCGSLKGAGDIRFVMWMLVFCSLGCLILPTIVILTYYPSLSMDLPYNVYFCARRGHAFSL